MSSATLLAKYLDSEKRKELVLEISKDLSNDDAINALYEVIDIIDRDTLAEIAPRITEQCKDSIIEATGVSKNDHILDLLQKLPEVSENVLDWIGSTIFTLVESRLNFICDSQAAELFKTYIKLDATKINNKSTTPSLEQLLTTLDKLLSLEVSGVSLSLDKLVCFLITIDESSISSQATKLLRWREKSLTGLQEFVLDLIPCLMASTDNVHRSNGYILWLRFLSRISKKNEKSEALESQLRNENYWINIQKGMGSEVHEHRKYCLSILKLSIQQLNIDIDNELVFYSESNSTEILEEWKRFCTLFEIIGIDTALNQAVAAKNDIHQLLSPNSYIKPSWGIVLLSTAFQGSMESVRKFALNIMLSTPADRLQIYVHELLTSVFLRQAVEAPYFVVKKVGDKLECQYGRMLEKFITNLLRSLKGTENLFEQTVSQLLNLLVDLSSIFAPARVYISLGLLKGLRGQQVFNEDHALKLYKLFDSTAEDEVFEKTLQTIHLKLLAHLQPNIPLLVESLTKFVHYNGYELFTEHKEVFLEYIAKYKESTDCIHLQNREVEYQIVAFSLTGNYSISDEFLTELAYSKIDHTEDFSKEYIVLLTRLINASAADYKNADKMVKLEMFKNSWRSLNFKPLYESVLSKFNEDKFTFFVAAYTKASDSSDLTVLNFTELKNLYKQLGKINQDYKVKDNIFAGFFDLCLAYMKTTPLSEEELDQFITLLDEQASSAFFLTNISVCNSLKYLFKSYDFDLITAIEILEKIWDQVTAERLVLNQKSMHLNFIETLFDEKLLKNSINNEYNAKILERIGLEIVDQSYTRRSFLPTLTFKILSYQTGYKTEFDQTTWMFELLLKSFSLVQDETNLFRLKVVLAEIYDNELKFYGDLYEDVFGAEEVSSKVNIINLLLSSSESFVSEFFQSLVEEKKYHLLDPEKKANGIEERQRVSSFELLLLVTRHVQPELLSSLVFKYLLPALVTESSPLVRTYIEWIVGIDMLNSIKNRDALFNYFSDQSKPALVTSVERIAFMVAQQLPSEERASYFEKFCQRLIPNCTSNKPLVRHFSNSLILSVYPALKSKGIELAVNNILESLYTEARKSEVTGQYRSGDALIWDLKKDFTLTSIFGGVLSRISPREVDVITKAKFAKYSNTEAIADVDIGLDQEPSWKKIKEAEEVKDSNVNSPLQTKSGAWESVIDLDENTRSIKRSELIVVSSLVDKPPNLGGICRLCDVLGAGLMTVDDLRVKKHPQFKNVAVTADYWMPMTEVNIADIPTFMRTKKKEGYTLIGLEQTDQSIVLGKDTEFPAKSLILLGKEAEGIPGELLAELDYCIEIRQMGVIRSMNIQTATAVIVHAYSSSQFS